MIFAILLYYYRKQKQFKLKEEKNAIHIMNPMVILIGIGWYDNDAKDSDFVDKAGYFNILNVDIDMRNLLTFCDKMKYQTFPKLDRETPKIEWTQDELITFLEKHAQIFEDSIKQNDENS
eukprot:217654_1